MSLPHISTWWISLIFKSLLNMTGKSLFLTFTGKGTL
ncbi:hypothetical protein LINPERHAP1_LOCUS26456 [Linum perenne]